MSNDTRDGVKARRIIEMVTNVIHQHALEYWSLLPTLTRMFDMEANIDAWPIPTSSDVMAPEALAKIGIGPNTAKVFNTQNRNLYLHIAKALPEVVLDCCFETQVGDPDTYMRTIHGIEEDALSIIGAFYFPNSVTTEEKRHQMYQVLKDCHLEFGRKNQSLEDSIRLVSHLAKIGHQMRVVIKHSLCTKKIILSLILSRPQLQTGLDKFFTNPVGPDADDCLAHLPGILAKVKQLANTYKQLNSTSLEYVKLAQCPETRKGGVLHVDEHSASMATYDSRILEVDPDYKREIYAIRREEPQGGWEEIDREEANAAFNDRGPQRGNNKQQKGGRSKGPSTFEHRCTVAGCTGKVDAATTSHVADENKKRKDLFQDPDQPPRLLNYICKGCWNKRSVVTLTNGFEMDMKAINEKKDDRSQKGKGKRSGKGKGGRGRNGGRKESAHIANNDETADTFEDSIQEMTLTQDSIKETVTTVLDEIRAVEQAAKLAEDTLSLADQQESVQNELNEAKQELAVVNRMLHNRSAIHPQESLQAALQRGDVIPSRQAGQAAIAARAHSAAMQAGGTLRTEMGPRDPRQYRDVVG